MLTESSGDYTGDINAFKKRVQENTKDATLLATEFKKLRAIQDKNEQSKLDPTKIAGGGTLKMEDLNTEESGMIMTINNRINQLTNIKTASNLLQDPTFLSSSKNF
jgi:hypothetical protein